MIKTDSFYELDKEIIDFFNEVEKDFAFAMHLKYVFQGSSKQKQLITVKKIADNYAVILKAEVIVTINDQYFDKFDDEIRTILFEQELDKIQINYEKGTIKIGQSSLKTSAGIVKKHTYEKVERAIEAQRLLVENKEEDMVKV